MDNLQPPQRCAALYRVSTPRQITRDAQTDETLPVQRAAIRAFVQDHPGWSLVAEYREEGVSAYRNAAAARDVLQNALRDAANDAFDQKPSTRLQGGSVIAPSLGVPRHPRAIPAGRRHGDQRG